MTKPRHRYLLANYVLKPRDKNKTHIKGYMADPKNQQYDEVVSFSLKLKTSDMYMQAIILDLDGQKVLKNRFGENKNFEEMLNYFFQNYKEQIIEYLVRTQHLAPVPPKPETDESNTTEQTN